MDTTNLPALLHQQHQNQRQRQHQQRDDTTGIGVPSKKTDSLPRPPARRGYDYQNYDALLMKHPPPPHHRNEPLNIRANNAILSSPLSRKKLFPSTMEQVAELNNMDRNNHSAHTTQAQSQSQYCFNESNTSLDLESLEKEGDQKAEEQEQNEDDHHQHQEGEQSSTLHHYYNGMVLDMPSLVSFCQDSFHSQSGHSSLSSSLASIECMNNNRPITPARSNNKVLKVVDKLPFLPSPPPPPVDVDATPKLLNGKNQRKQVLLGDGLSAPPPPPVMTVTSILRQSSLAAYIPTMIPRRESRWQVNRSDSMPASIGRC